MIEDRQKESIAATDPFEVSSMWVAKSRLIIGPEFTMEFSHERPNKWWRFWYWTLFGWRWEAA